MQHRYFASSNSSEGFKNRYREVFGRADKLYVIKGGPGTGKSSLMKKCALAAEKKGYGVEYYYCSSDPESLDGVLIFVNGEAIGIVDGTAPHLWEPELVGAREELIDLGRFWNSELLREQKNEILALNNKKSAAYRRAYAYLRSCGNLRAVTDSLLKKATDYQKLRSAAERLARSLDLENGKASVIPAITCAVSMNGRCKLDTFEQGSERLWRVSDFYGVGEWFLDELADCLGAYNASLRLSYDPINADRTDGIFVENIKCGFVLSRHDSSGAEEREENENDKLINPKRFIHTEKLREIRGELRYAARLYQDCLDGALHALSEAKVYHFLLEDIYKHAMHFGALGEFAKEFVEKIVK